MNRVAQFAQTREIVQPTGANMVRFSYYGTDGKKVHVNLSRRQAKLLVRELTRVLSR